ncbi:MAG: butyrate kinase [Synergistaceae bacterium]|nr:butyrate kinase [Synergistaceae bacterium]
MKILAFISKISTTEFAVFDDGVQVLSRSVEHPAPALHTCLEPKEEGQFRLNAMLEVLDEETDIKLVDMIATQVECRDLPCGIYLIDRHLVDCFSTGSLEENHQRAAIFMAYTLAEFINDSYDAECIPIAVEPAIENEIMRDAVLSGLKGITRTPVFHFFSQRAAASIFAWENNKGLNDIRLIIAHLGTEISVGAYDRGRIIDSNSPLDGEGPFSPSTSGTLPTDELVDLCFSGKYDMDEMLAKVTTEGGLTAHLGSWKLSAVQEAWREGDERTRLLVRAMAGRVAKEIGARAAALRGMAEEIILTGPWAVFTEFTDEIESRVRWIASTRTCLYGNEFFMLANAATEIFRGNIKLFLYDKNNR